MAPSLLPGDHILVDRSHYPKKSPVRGDVVVFTLADDPSTQKDESEVCYC